MHAFARASVLVPALAFVEDSRAFVGTAQLLGVVAHFLPAALFARLRDGRIASNVSVVDTLNFGALRPQRRREGVGLGASDDCLQRCVCATCERPLFAASRMVCAYLCRTRRRPGTSRRRSACLRRRRAGFRSPCKRRVSRWQPL
jgi:hypothetical protein